MKDFRQLSVWQKAHSLTLLSYKLTARFPEDERYGLTSQIRRCSASIGANIAEGCGKSGNAEFNRFILIAAGSASELEYHWLLARDLGLVSQRDYEIVQAQTSEVGRMLNALSHKVRADQLAHA
jgi:four helix bundle protein